MAEVKTTQTDSVVVSEQSDSGSFWKRELNGATFLTLEHAGHMVLVVVVAMLLAAGIVTALNMWTGKAALAVVLDSTWQSDSAIAMVAALVVLIPFLVILDRRTRAEWLKRPGYATRLAYKAPIYVALGVLVAAKVAATIQMLGVVLHSLALIGVSGTDFGDMYLREFVPALIAAIVFGAGAWYLFKLAKGRDLGRAYSTFVALIGGALAIALFVTAVISLHTPAPTPHSPTLDPATPHYFDDLDGSNDLEDLFR